MKANKSTKAPSRGRFGVYGGRYVPETLMAALEELERDFRPLEQALPHMAPLWIEHPDSK